MGDNQGQPAQMPEPPRQAGNTAPGSAAPRTGFLAAASNRLRHTVLPRVPGARPRRKFEFPPEAVLPASAEEASEAVRSTPGATDDNPIRSMNAHPIHFGFMATVGVGFALLGYFILTNVGELLVWIGAALFIALGLDPVVRWLAARGIPRPAGILLTVVGLAGIVAAFFATLIPTIVSQTTEIINNAPGYVNTFLESDFFVNIDEQFHVRERIEEEVNKFFTNADALGGVFGGVLSVGTVIANGLFGALIILVLTLYFLASLPSMKMWAYRLAPRSRRRRVEALSEEITSSVGNYVIGQGVVAVLDATYAFIVMSIAGVPFSVLLAFVVALLAFIPLVGPPIALVLVSLVALTVSWQTAVVFALFYIAYLQFEAYFVSPRIMQRAVAVPGAVAVIAVIAGGTLLGVLGALIAIPTAAAVLLLLKDVFISRQDQR
ncbi:AI-2E family transporter [Arthrobacter sp. zg-ZUI100]|uniref:AI-2E family transporter n=1 Tax=Arthrobacter jiangjiafuii TaxID=2817475 RepID=UPI001AEE2672|nr:AI-2E family transporter [Arthrobacter jiangjiafuii]MBP3034704.1 AI-2E family transporter [Arthrobacter jiangjiafuii]